jgi:transcriptional activator protein UGA3
MCFPLFCKMHLIAGLSTQRRHESRATSNGYVHEKNEWTDEALYDFVASADDLERQLAQEKTQAESLIRSKWTFRPVSNETGKPSLSPHRFLHEAFRIASLLALRSFVFCEPPSTYRIQLLVRQALSLLEEMQDKDLPGYCSAHWVLFVTALCSGGSEPVTHGGIGAARDRSRIEKLYDIKQ